MATLASEPSVPRHIASAKEHLAGVHAGRIWAQELAAAHLLDTEHPAHERALVAEEKETQ